MPDKRRHRGPHPEDARLFAENQLSSLRQAVGELAWLLTRRYARDSSLKLVGDRHNLTARQRMAVMRSACSDQSLQKRREKLTTLTHPERVPHPLRSKGWGMETVDSPPLRRERSIGHETPSAAKGWGTRNGKRKDCRPLGVDGYNLLITIESALSGGVILIGRDGCYRDLASVHGTYRKVEETIPAVKLIADYLRPFDIARVEWYLDRPVSNSGRLKALMAEIVGGSGLEEDPRLTWNIELVDSPDAVLAGYAGPVATSDSAVLDRCTSWINLAAQIIDDRIPDAWRVRLDIDD